VRQSSNYFAPLLHQKIRVIQTIVAARLQTKLSSDRRQAGQFEALGR